jgi:acyl-CoA dehydrogenase
VVLSSQGEIRSAFLMTEPEVASSDATNIQTSIRLEADAQGRGTYVINGRKWWSSGVRQSDHPAPSFSSP